MSIYSYVFDKDDIGDGLTNAGDEYTSGNGSIMRLAPIPIFYHDDLK
jgi:ADP-ribosyl-[dinitrogen reductase] hydrolase